MSFSNTSSFTVVRSPCPRGHTVFHTYNTHDPSISHIVCSNGEYQLCRRTDNSGSIWILGGLTSPPPKSVGQVKPVDINDASEYGVGASRMYQRWLSMVWIRNVKKS